MLFEEVAATAGVQYVYRKATPAYARMGGGAVAEDFNNDGWIDLYCAQGAGGPNRLYINYGGTFSNEAALRGADYQGECTTLSAADFDNDDDIDICIMELDARPRVLINDGTGNFTNTLLLSETMHIATGSSWGDVDNDGFLELVMGQWTIPAQTPEPTNLFLYRNNGGASLSVYDFHYHTFFDKQVFSPRFADINNDRLQDLVICSDFGESQLYLNIGGAMYSNITFSSRLGTNGHSETTAIRPSRTSPRRREPRTRGWVVACSCSITTMTGHWICLS